MTRRSTNYKLLFAGIIAFIAIMTLDVEALQQGSPIEIIKAIIGVVATLYLIIANLRNFREARKQ